MKVFTMEAHRPLHASGEPVRFTYSIYLFTIPKTSHFFLGDKLFFLSVTHTTNHVFYGESNNLYIVYVDPMPADYEQYYGFTKFALELNELDPQTKPLLPPTDTRLRLDQR